MPQTVPEHLHEGSNYDRDLKRVTTEKKETDIQCSGAVSRGIEVYRQNKQNKCLLQERSLPPATTSCTVKRVMAPNRFSWGQVCISMKYDTVGFLYTIWAETKSSSLHSVVDNAVTLWFLWIPLCASESTCHVCKPLWQAPLELWSSRVGEGEWVSVLIPPPPPPGTLQPPGLRVIVFRDNPGPCQSIQAMKPALNTGNESPCFKRLLARRGDTLGPSDRRVRPCPVILPFHFSTPASPCPRRAKGCAKPQKRSPTGSCWLDKPLWEDVYGALDGTLLHRAFDDVLFWFWSPFPQPRAGAWNQPC